MNKKPSVEYIDRGKSIAVNFGGLSPREQKLISILKRKKEVKTSEITIATGLEGNALHLAIARLKRKIAPVKIKAVYGTGYRLEQ